ncbi:MAG: helix-turn-helix transcriptional regulator [Oscillospiraceae bacterium]|nr:helix-turn-helix transcriptional regulator [Oscillospiraceae bacterium]
MSSERPARGLPHWDRRWDMNTEVLVRVCNFLRCDLSDICEVILDEEKPVKQAQDFDVR